MKTFTNNLSINLEDIAAWFNSIRNLSEERRTRALESFYSGQLLSKGWLIHCLSYYVEHSSNVYIFGGWTGVLSSMLFNSKIPVKKIRSIDMDPLCEEIADTINKPYEMDGWRFKAVTADMTRYDYDWGITSDVVINTVCEHLTQEAYTEWYDRIATGSLIVAQSNNYFSCPEHIRCNNNLNEFMDANYVRDALFSGHLHTKEYTRYMSIWRK